MSILAENLDYTDRDFDAIELRLEALIRSVFPDWTDFNVANFGVTLTNLFAFVTDILTFYQDNQAVERFIVTATQRRNLIALVKLINFQPSSATAAVAQETFTLAAPMAGTVTLPIGTIVQTTDITAPENFQLLAPLVFDPGQTVKVGTVENTASRNDAFVSNGLPNQSIVLPGTPYVDSTAIVTAADGGYTQVQDFLGSTGTDRHYLVSIDQNDKATITFGNGVNGKIPVSPITVVSKTGGGAAGNVEAGSIKRLVGTFTDSLSNAARITVTNVSKATGGLDRQTNQQIKTLAPASLRALVRTVAREDFEINAQKITGVARALMTTSNEDPGVPENSGILYVVPPDSGAPSQALKDAVKDQFISRMGWKAPLPSTLTFIVRVQNPLYLTINILATVYFRATVTPATGAAAIRANLAAFFAATLPDGTPNPAIDFGFNYRDANGDFIGTIPLSDVFDIVKDTAQVLRVGGRSSDFQMNGAHADIPILVRQFPKLGSVTLINGIDGSLV